MRNLNGRNVWAGGRAMLAAAVGMLLSTAGLGAQSVVSGVVVDSVSGSPIAGAVVFAAEPGVRTATDAEGRFRLDDIETPTSLFVSAYGFHRRTVEGVTSEPVTIRLTRAPFLLEGIEASVTRFETRLDSIHTLLDRSAKGSRWGYTTRGVPKIATREDIQRYDEDNDPEIALAALGLYPSFDFECGWRGGGHGNRPTVIYIDGKKPPDFLECMWYRQMDVSNICRLELIPTGKLYVWSCAYLARLADGQESVPKMLELVLPPWWRPGG